MEKFLVLSTQLDDNQRHELGKTMFSLGNLSFSSLILGSLVIGTFEPGLFIIGIFRQQFI